MEEKICGRLEREKCWVNNKWRQKKSLSCPPVLTKRRKDAHAKEGETQRRQLSVQTKRKAQYKIKPSGRIGQAMGRSQGEMTPYIVNDFRYLDFYFFLIQIYSTKLICLFINTYALSSDIGSARSSYQCVLCLCLTWNWHPNRNHKIAYKESGENHTGNTFRTCRPVVTVLNDDADTIIELLWKCVSSRIRLNIFIFTDEI